MQLSVRISERIFIGPGRCLHRVATTRSNHYFGPNWFVDISHDCSNGQKITQFLTNQMGPSDAAVFIIDRNGPFHCKIRYVTSKGFYVMLVIEFMNWIAGQRHCGDEKNEIALILRWGPSLCSAMQTFSCRIPENFRYNSNRNDKEVQVCDVVDRNNYIFRITGTYDVTVNVKAVGDMGALRITSTSLRGIRF